MKITQVRSASGANKKQRDTLRTLGLGKIGKTSERRKDDAAVQGAVRTVSHLVRVD